MLAAFEGFDIKSPVLWIVIACIVVTVTAVILMVVFAVKANKAKSGHTAKKIKTEDGVRYTVDENVTVGGGVNITHNEGDIMLVKGKTYTAKKDGELLPGTYTVLSSAKGETKFNIRLGSYVREYSHGDEIVIPENEKITATSHNLILR